MNKYEAEQLIDLVCDGGRAEAMISVIFLGLEYYKRNKDGINCLNEYHFTNIERRLLTASVFTAFDSFQWGETGLAPNHDTQKSSHRTYLQLGDIWIDIVRNGRSDARFYDARFRRNRSLGMEGERYVQLNYRVDPSGGDLLKVEIRVPRSKKTAIAARKVYPDEA